MQVSQFSAPLPGSSLALNKPGDRPFERPPQLDTVEQALGYYFKSFSNDEVIDDLMTLLEMGIPINPVVKTIYTSSVMNGVHNLDVGLLVAPVLSEFLASVATSYGIEHKFSDVDPKKQKEENDYTKIHMLFQAAIDKGIEEEGVEDEGVQMLKDMAQTLEREEPMEDVEEQLPESEPQMQGAGLMAREGM